MIHFPQSRIIVGIDPGMTSGCCMVEAVPGLVKVLEHYQAEGTVALIEWLSGQRRKIAGVVLEDYLGSGHRTKPAIITIQAIGAVKAWCSINDVPLMLHNPQWRKAFVKPARAMLGTGHANRHAADALAHILSYEYRKGVSK